MRGSRSSRPQQHKRPKASYVRFQAEQPNEYWQLDITHWELADGSAVDILNVIDDHSRRCLDSHAQRTFKGPDVDRRFRVTATTYGDPASLLSDNAAVFTGAPRPRPPRPAQAYAARPSAVPSGRPIEFCVVRHPLGAGPLGHLPGSAARSVYVPARRARRGQGTLSSATCHTQTATRVMRLT